MLSKAYREINIVLDDYRVDTKKQVAKLKEDMKSRDLLHLLPGAAYAFALRNRKWGQCLLNKARLSDVWFLRTVYLNVLELTGKV